MNNCIKTGAYVFLIDYQRYAPADIYAVGDARVVKFARDPLTIPGGNYARRPVTHVLHLSVGDNVWRQGEGLAVVEGKALIQCVNDEER